MLDFEIPLTPKPYSTTSDIVEQDSTLGEFAALLSAVNFPSFEQQPAYRADLAALAETTLADSSRARRADLDVIVKRLEQDSEDKTEEDADETETEEEADNLKRVLAVTAEETNILWWIFGGRSRDTNESFGDFANEVIPFVAAKELADLTALLPGHVAISAIADRICKSDREKPSQTVTVTAAIKKLPKTFVTDLTGRWGNHPCRPLCRLTREILGGQSGWGKAHKLRTTDLALLFYRECLVPRAWKNISP